ncbi:hypothetical protein JCM8097_000019 [Rhodosporidiobolus ruineniae]
MVQTDYSDPSLSKAVDRQDEDAAPFRSSRATKEPLGAVEMGKDEEESAPFRRRDTTSKHQPQSVVVEGLVVEDAVFGAVNDGEGGPNYRSLGWIRTSVLLVKTQIGLGVLGIPSILGTLGLVPGIILILAIACLTTWCDYVVGRWKMACPECYSMADIGRRIAGRPGQEILGAVYWDAHALSPRSFVSGAGMLSVATAFNAMTDNAGCTLVWALVGAILTFLISAIRTLDKISWLGWVGLVGIMSAVLTLAVAVGVQDRPSTAPPVGPWDPQVVVVGAPSFLNAMSAVATIVFSFAGAPNFVNILAEMRRPEDFTKSLITCQTFVTTVYLGRLFLQVIGCVVYHFCGIYVASPALGSAGELLKKVCYGIALPGLIIGCVLNSHLTSKYTFLRIFGKTKHVNSNSLRSWSIWLSCVFTNVAISWIIAEAIPFFDDLLSLIGALLSTFMCLTTCAFMYLWKERSRLRTDRSPGFLALVALNVFIICAGFFIQVSGTVASVISINKSLKGGNTTQPFGC